MSSRLRLAANPTRSSCRPDSAEVGMQTSSVDRDSGPAPIGRYRIETWGCQMNVHDSEKLAGSLERQGYVRADGLRDADVKLAGMGGTPG